MKNSTIWFATICIQALLLVGLVVREELVLRGGARVVLAVDAVDPMDLLSGRYIRVPLGIQRIDIQTVAHPGVTPSAGETVYVRLEEQAGQFEAVEISSGPVDQARGPWARAVAMAPWTGQQNSPWLRLDYSVDRFYIPDTGGDPSVLRRENGERFRIQAVARIAGDGRVVIEDLLVDGVPYAEWNAQRKD